MRITQATDFAENLSFNNSNIFSSEMVGSEQPSGTKYLSKLQLTYQQEDVAKKKDDVKKMEASKVRNLNIAIIN